MQPTLVAAQKDTDDLLVKLDADQRDAAQARELAERDAEVAVKVQNRVQAIADDCQRDLDEAMPAYYKAIKALDALDKKAIQEVKSFVKPPEMVAVTMEAVNILLGEKPEWKVAKTVLTDMQFLEKLKAYDKDNISHAKMKQLKKYMSDPRFVPEKVEKVSTAAKCLCMWVHAIATYDKVVKTIAPKRKKLAEAESELDAVNHELCEA